LPSFPQVLTNCSLTNCSIRDPLTFNPRGQLFGYPPVYYPAAPDFATAAVVRLSPGETFDAKVSPQSEKYYAVSWDSRMPQRFPR